MADTPEKSEVAKREEEVLAFWQERKIFEKTLAKKAPKGDYSFYDGPPFATGTPHYGHIVASVMKDAIPRYKTMRGYRVPRVWGWDTHGLPIENLVEKELGFKHKKEIREYGIEKFNERCRELVMEYVDEWKKVIPRIGRFADMEHPYRTMDPSFMESVWWVFKQIYDQGLIYEDYRSMHICPRCETTLSQQEVSEGYKDTKDIAVTAKFRVKNPEKVGLSGDVYLLAWTTTPWTLPGNVALAVGPALDYVVADAAGVQVIVETSRLGTIANAAATDTAFRGSDLIGLEYEPIFDYYAKDSTLKNRQNGWKVYAADFVTTDTGTGIVHIAPAFGEDDMALGKEKQLPFVQHVSYDGTMKPEVTDFAGLEVKPRSDDDRERLSTDIAIIKYLQEHGAFFAKENLTHSYPLCWRCDTPLLNYATTSWFVAVTKIKDKLLENAKSISWTPEHMKEGRFGKWLQGARDWSISRQRYWASVMPIWKDSRGGITVIGSLEELKKHVKKSGNRYFMMRHGESEKNVKDIVSSDRSSNGLTARGEVEVRTGVHALKKEGIRIIYASPLTRAKETAELAAKTLGLSKDSIVYDERLRELEFGSLSGKPFAEFLAYRKEHMQHFTEQMPGGESYDDARKRFAAFLYEIESKHKDTPILIVTHGVGLESFTTIAQGGGAAALKRTVETVDFKTGVVHPLSFVPLPHNRTYELDYHLPYIDEIELVTEQGERLTRVPDVLDTWFDSGSMPYAQVHYPFEKKEAFKETFPAEFIGEGVDQTRAWFYYLHVFAGALFGKPAFKNVAVNGIVLAEDGKKMSKRLKNYPDPMEIIERYGADAMRYYLLASPVVAAENLAFAESGVDEVAKKNVGRLTNVLSFYQLFADGTPRGTGSMDPLDRWIRARLDELVRESTESYERYELDRAVRPLSTFIDDLSTWYLRRSRDRFKGEGNDKAAALSTLRYVLIELAKVAAPAMPFIAEHLFQSVREEGDPESVHLADWPTLPSRGFLARLFGGGEEAGLLHAMARVRALASDALQLRQRAGIKVRQPLHKLSIPDTLPAELTAILADEVNVKYVHTNASVVEIDTALTPELIAEGDTREFARQIAEARKSLGLSPKDTARVVERSDGAFSVELSTGTARFDLERDSNAS